MLGKCRQGFENCRVFVRWSLIAIQQVGHSWWRTAPFEVPNTAWKHASIQAHVLTFIFNAALVATLLLESVDLLQEVHFHFLDFFSQWFERQNHNVHQSCFSHYGVQVVVFCSYWFSRHNIGMLNTVSQATLKFLPLQVHGWHPVQVVRQMTCSRFHHLHLNCHKNQSSINTNFDTLEWVSILLITHPSHTQKIWKKKGDKSRTIE
jgi:hypothetical protein